MVVNSTICRAHLYNFKMKYSPRDYKFDKGIKNNL